MIHGKQALKKIVASFPPVFLPVNIVPPRCKSSCQGELSRVAGVLRQVQLDSVECTCNHSTGETEGEGRRLL